MLNYQQKLSPWTIVRIQPNLRHVTVARFRRRGDAEGHLRALKRMMPEAEFAIMFDVAGNNSLKVPSIPPQEKSTD